MKSIRKQIGKQIFTVHIANAFLYLFDKFSAELHPIPVKDEVWHTIGVDFIGPLPITQKGNKYIMTDCSP